MVEYARGVRGATVCFSCVCVCVCMCVCVRVLRVGWFLSLADLISSSALHDFVSELLEGVDRQRLRQHVGQLVSAPL